MGKTLTEIAQQLKDANKKVQLIYGFNATGKTRLSRAFKDLIAPKTDSEDGQQSESAQRKILYYSAFTEDLFYWDNDLEEDVEPKLRIQPNTFTDWVLKEQGQDMNVITTFQRYTNDKLTPRFNPERTEKDKDGKDVTIRAFSEVTFSIEGGDATHSGNLKISKGEESNFIWSVFHSLIEQAIFELNIAEVANRSTDVFDNLEYVFIDDPVSSLDENHLIELAVNLASLIKSSQTDLRFIITTHNPLFYNVLYNELNSRACYMLEGFEDGSFSLTGKKGDSNQSFSYHLHLKHTIERAVEENKVERYHFTLLRNLYEKTSNFLGYPKWSDLLPDDKQLYLSRIITFTSHSTLSNEAVAEPSQAEKATVKFLLDRLSGNYGYWQEQQNG